MVLAKERFGLRGRDLSHAHLVPFSAHTRMSGVDVDGRSVRKGAVDAVKRWIAEMGGLVPVVLFQLVEGVATAGGTPLVVADGPRVLGVIHLKDVVEEGIEDPFERLRRMGIRTVMITGDNPLTAKAIAMEAGVDDFLAEATPEDKMELIRREQAGGRLVAMTGDGTNDAPALAQADVGVTMNSGTQAAKEAGNMVDLDSNPTKLIEIVEIGKQLLITRGALTTFSISNDVAKYFAIIPAMFMGVFPSLDALNIMGLATPRSAILAVVVFQRVGDHRPHSTGPEGGQIPCRRARRRCCGAICRYTPWAGWLFPSSASSCSTWRSMASGWPDATSAGPCAGDARAPHAPVGSGVSRRGHRRSPASVSAPRPVARWSRSTASRSAPV